VIKNITELKKDIEFSVHLRGQNFRFLTTWGLFSPEKIDNGSYMLIESCEVKPNDDILDMGSGYGAIGIALAKSTNGKVDMVDKDFVAVEYSKKNAEINKVDNCKTYLSNGFEQIGDKQYDVIVSNLPAKVSKEFFWILFREAKKHLKPNGKFYVVVISGLKEFIKRNFEEVFGNYKKVTHSNDYMVALAINTAKPVDID
jgi:16S rRNA G1207 methylase RsmC